MIRSRKLVNYASMLAVATFAISQARAQQVANPAPATSASTTGAASDESDQEVVKLTPFEVSADTETGYNAATTLAGNRLNTDLRDLGNAVSVVTKQFLQDTGAVDNQSLLQYLPSGEVGNVNGNFSGLGDSSTPDPGNKFINPNQNTRVRGLTSADNTRNFFLTDIPWDGYNVDRVDFQRGPNSILFGQGSPAGIINAGTQVASFKNSGSLETRLGSFGTNRIALNINQVLIPKQLAARIALLRNDNQYEQDPAYSLDKRLYAAMRYEPSFLNKNGIHTVFQANIEFGDINSNNPRIIPPYDTITPWFYNGTTSGVNTAGKAATWPQLNRSTYIPNQLQDDNSSHPNHGQQRPQLNHSPVSGNPNPAYQPWLGNFGQQFGSPLLFVPSAGATPTMAWNDEPYALAYGGIDSNGNRDGSLGEPFNRPAGVATYSTFAVNARLPFWDSGVYKDKSLTDPSVFNFYKNLLDGPTKREWQNFRTYNLSLAQTYFNDQLGWELQYNREWWKGGQEGIFTTWRAGIGVDVNSVFSDGTPDSGATGEPFRDGTPNPNLGRPYITDNGANSNNETIHNRESGRLTGFARHDFAHDEKLPQWLGDFLGSHTITGLWSEDRLRSDYRQWLRWSTPASLDNFTHINDVFTGNSRIPDVYLYLGPSLANRTSASGANIPRPTSDVSVPSQINYRIFDSTWNPKNGAKPSDPWNNYYYVQGVDNTGTNPPGSPFASFQSENPANYNGWINYPLTIINADTSKAARDQLTFNAQLTKNVVKSKAFVWQGHLWKNFLVATGGFRRDTAEGWSAAQNTNNSVLPDQVLNLTPNPIANGSKTQPGYLLPGQYQTRIDVNSRSWSIMAHLTDWLGERAPVKVSVYYAKSNNFQPFSNRVDAYGHALGAPSGKTNERGVLLETRDGKYSLKIDKYRTTSSLQDSSALPNAWFIGSSQAWAANWVNRFQYNWTQDTIAGAVANPDPNNTEYNYEPAFKADGTKETLAEAQTREANAISAWRTWQASVNPDFYKAWGINLNDNTRAVGAAVPTGFAVTEDSSSEGYEVELNAQPTRNWRITFNATKTDAVRENIGGAALSDFITKYETALNTTPVGDLRIWWGGAGNQTTLVQWQGTMGTDWHQKKLEEGTSAPEIRKWHWNLVTNYDFDQGILKGVGVGGGIRYQSSVVIGYRPFQASPTLVSFDLTNPYRGPGETAVDLWASYTHKLTDKITWRIQLNIANVNYNGDALIPITVEPDGSGATYRIRPPRTWQLTNTFMF